MIRYLPLFLLPRCGVIGRKGQRCTKRWGHKGNHRYERLPLAGAKRDEEMGR